jgi:predicted nucleotidyltransferase
MSVELLECAAAALGPLVDEVVFVGGASIVLWITHPAAPPPRPTNDVDVVVEVATRLEYERFAQRMRAQGFCEDIGGHVICRWRHGDSDLLLDLMPTDPAIFGFFNRWHVAALPHAVERRLPSGLKLRAVTAPYLLATKLEAFAERGGGDLIASRDFEDAIALVDGRAELVDEIGTAAPDLRAFLAEAISSLRTKDRFLDGAAGALRPDAASQARLEAVVLPTLDAIVGSAP